MYILDKQIIKDIDTYVSGYLKQYEQSYFEWKFMSIPKEYIPKALLLAKGYVVNLDTIVEVNEDTNEVFIKCVTTDNKIYLPNNCNYLFGECNSIGVFNTDNLYTLDIGITSMEGMFFNCLGLEDIEIGKFITKDTVKMNSIFKDCLNLRHVGFKGADVRNMYNMANMFTGCENLEEVDFWDKGTTNTLKLEYLNGAFEDCYELVYLDMSMFTFDNLKHTEYMFINCSKLYNIDFGETCTKEIVDMTCMFYNCENLYNIELNIEDLDFSKLDKYQNMLTNCGLSERVDLLDIIRYKIEELYLDDDII